MKRAFCRTLASGLIASLIFCVGSSAADLKGSLKSSGFKLIHESYVNGNWDLFVVNADGSDSVNLTNTPDQQELYPQVSPDGKKIAYISDRGKGRKTVRSVHVMNIDGSDRKKASDFARQPFWHPNSRLLGYLPQEYSKFNVVDYATKGIAFYDTATGEIRRHPNEEIYHLYNPSFRDDGKWIVSTVHAHVDYKHAILLIEADGSGVYDLKIPGCRPTFSPDGKKVAWGPGDHEIAVAEIDMEANPPRMKSKQFSVFDKKLKIYHVDWSPDGNFLSISRGPTGEGDLSKVGTHASACEIVGVHAAGWDLIAVSANRDSDLDLANAGEEDFVSVTKNGASNKESDWFE
jgi:Tol biopolymer transport system component